MATEAPLIHDGGQCIAAANYGNSASIAGVNQSGTTGSGSGQFLCVVKNTTSRQVAVAAATAGLKVYGILQNKPAALQAADVGIFGISKVVADSAGVTCGDFLMTSSNTAGCAMTWTTTHYSFGQALETAAAGAVFTAFIYPPTLYT